MNDLQKDIFSKIENLYNGSLCKHTSRSGRGDIYIKYQEIEKSYFVSDVKYIIIDTNGTIYPGTNHHYYKLAAPITIEVACSLLKEHLKFRNFK